MQPAPSGAILSVPGSAWVPGHHGADRSGAAHQPLQNGTDDALWDDCGGNTSALFKSSLHHRRTEKVCVALPRRTERAVHNAHPPVLSQGRLRVWPGGSDPGTGIHQAAGSRCAVPQVPAVRKIFHSEGKFNPDTVTA